MVIVGVIPVRDEVSLIEANIDYHLRLGFDGLVILDICSTDGTSELLQKYSGNVTVLNCPVQPIASSDESGTDFDYYHRLIVDTAKKVYKPDYIFYFDPDEFIYCSNHDLRKSVSSFESPCVKLHRYNCLSAISPGFTAPRNITEIDSHIVVSKPPIKAQDINNALGHSWIFSNIGPKTAVQNQFVSRFTHGGHAALDGSNQMIPSVFSDQVFVTHYAITTFERFLNKIKNINVFYDELERNTRKFQSYNWKRWVKIFREFGEEGLHQEYISQINSTHHEQLKAYTSYARDL